MKTNVQIKAFPRKFAENVEFGSDCWLWTSVKSKNGYGRYRVKGVWVRAHRYAWELFNGRIPDGLNVLHKCDIRNCVNPEHLFLGTHQDNMDDMAMKGRGATGEKHGRAKLTQNQIDEIRKLYRFGFRGVRNEFSTYGLAKRFGVGKTQIGRIVNQEHWVNVK